MTVRSTKVTFTGSQGEPLAALLDLPVGPASAYAVFVHCFTCSKDIFAAARIAGALAARGIGVLRFDFTGLGHSEGEFGHTGVTSNGADLSAAADWLRATHAAPGLLVGHSLGGAAVLASRTVWALGVAVSLVEFLGVYCRIGDVDRHWLRIAVVMALHLFQ